MGAARRFLARVTTTVVIITLTPVSASVSASPATASTAGSSAFRGVDPVRILDTRGGPRPGTNSSTVVAVAGVFGVPADATSVVLNVTAYQPDRAGFVTVYPWGSAQPNTSNVNMSDNRTIVPNLVTAKVGVWGNIVLYASVGSHLIVDLFGYYVPATTSRIGRFVPADAPRRVLDTRRTTVVPVDGRVNVQIPSEVPFATEGVEGLVFNVTAVDSKVRANGFAYWTAVAAGAALPETSNLNVLRAGQTIANQVIVRPNANGVDFYSYAGGNLVVDYMGYYTGSGAAVDDDGLFVAVAPTRLLDTRSGPDPLGASVALHHDWSVEVATTGTAGVPSTGASAVALNVTMTRAFDEGYVTVYPAGRARPDASNINSDRAGTTVPNHVQVRSATRGVTLYSYGGTDVIVDIFGWFIGSPLASIHGAPANQLPSAQYFPGQLWIPDVKLSTKVREHVYFVDKDPSHLVESRTPDQPGNVAIFGHRTSHGHEFRNLDKLRVGSPIYLTVDGKVYTYSTTAIDIRTPTDPMLYTTNSDNQTLSLVACHPPGSVKFRIVVHAELVDVGVL
ncbi:MAG: class E sortase [Acidimicrobiia bacterium]